MPYDNKNENTTENDDYKNELKMYKARISDSDTDCFEYI